MATTGKHQAVPLLDLLEEFPDLFEKEVLERLDPANRAFLGQVDAACRAAVVWWPPTSHARRRGWGCGS
jgi:hypothetical protein